MINIIIHYITCNNTCTIVICTMISMEYILIYSLIISLYSLIVFIINNKVVIVSVVNENIQVDFSNDNIPVDVGTIDVVNIDTVDN